MTENTGFAIILGFAILCGLIAWRATMRAASKAMTDEVLAHARSMRPHPGTTPPKYATGGMVDSPQMTLRDFRHYVRLLQHLRAQGLLAREGKKLSSKARSAV